MDGGFDFFSIIILAMIAGFLVMRLRSVLGRRTGHERQRPSPIGSGPKTEVDNDNNDNVVVLPNQHKDDEPEFTGPAASGLTQIRIADPSFDKDQFLAGSKMAFEMIVTAFANADRDTLKPLTSSEIYENLNAAIEERESAGHVFESTLVGIKSAEIVEARMEGRVASVTVRFISEQVNVTRDEEGQVLSGSASVVDEVTDVWTFTRDTRGSDPNWSLSETREDAD